MDPNSEDLTGSEAVKAIGNETDSVSSAHDQQSTQAELSDEQLNEVIGGIGSFSTSVPKDIKKFNDDGFIL